MLRLFYVKNKKHVDIAQKNIERFELVVTRLPLGSALVDFLNLNIDTNINKIKGLAESFAKDVSENPTNSITLQLSKINPLFPILELEYFIDRKRFIEHLQDTQKMFIKYIELAFLDEKYYDYDFFRYLVEKNLFKTQVDGYTRIKQKIAFRAEESIFDEKIDNYVDFTFYQNLEIHFDCIEVFKNHYFNSKKTSVGICYEVQRIADACIVEMYELFKRGMIIKKCKNCGKYFIPARSDALYCDNISPQDKTKTCKDYGAYEQYKQNIKSDEVKGLYRNIYMQKQMLSKRNFDIAEYKKDFENFKSDSKQWKANVKSGVKTETEFLSWLKSIKEKKVNPNGKCNKEG